MGNLSSKQKRIGGTFVLVLVLALVFLYIVCVEDSTEPLVLRGEDTCGDIPGKWCKDTWLDGEVLFERDEVESAEECAALAGEEDDQVQFLTYDHIYKVCTGKRQKTIVKTAYKMIALGHCADIEDNNISTLSYNKVFDTVIANRGVGTTPEWTDITDDTAKMAEDLDSQSEGVDQCSKGIAWLHEENLIIPGQTWMDCRANDDGGNTAGQMVGPRYCSSSESADMSVECIGPIPHHLIPWPGGIA